MVAVQGLYENGRIELSEDAPMKKANVIVIFPEEQVTKKHIIGKSHPIWYTSDRKIPGGVP